MPWFWAKEVKVAKEIGSEGKRKKKKLFSLKLYPGAFNPRIVFAAHRHSLSQETETGMRGLFFTYPVFSVCPIAHAPSVQSCNRTAVPGRAPFQHQYILSNPAAFTADDEAALSHKIWFLYLNEEGLWCFLLEGGGRRALLCPWSSASHSFALIISEVIAATVFLLLLLGAPCFLNRQFHLPELLIQGTC